MRCLVLLFLIVIVGCTTAITISNSTPPDHAVNMKIDQTGIDQGNLPPDFTVTATDGTQIKLSDFNEKPLLIYFMATWCPYCREDFTTLSDNYAEYNTSMLVVSLDLKDTNNKLAEYKSHFPKLEKVFFAEGNEDMLRNYQIRLTTTKYAIGRDGKILHKGSGAFSADQWKVLLNALQNS